MQTAIDILYPPPPTSFISSSSVWDGLERRQGISTLEQGSIMLSHAVQYLVSEQFAGRRLGLQANREAIMILSRARIEVGVVEQRDPARSKIHAKLRRFLCDCERV
jgi:hypothetical protein